MVWKVQMSNLDKCMPNSVCFENTADGISVFEPAHEIMGLIT